MIKQHWLDFAEVVDALRVIPRMLLFGFAGFYAYYIFWVTHWYMAKATDSGWDMAFASSTIAALGAMVTQVYNNYMVTERKWGR